MECDDQNKRSSPDAKESLSVIIPSDGKDKSLGQDSETYLQSEICEFNPKEVASTTMEKNTNEEQEIIVQTEIISHMKQPVSGLDSKEVRENQGGIISEVQESNHETLDKLLIQQVIQKPVKTTEKGKGGRRL